MDSELPRTIALILFSLVPQFHLAHKPIAYKHTTFKLEKECAMKDKTCKLPHKLFVATQSLRFMKDFTFHSNIQST